jgi:hypothetical protein
MISAVSWVPQGSAKATPERYELDEEEYQRICEMAQEQIDDAKADMEDAQNASVDADPELAEYDMANYDNDEDAEGLNLQGRIVLMGRWRNFLGDWQGFGRFSRQQRRSVHYAEKCRTRISLSKF